MAKYHTRSHEEKYTALEIVNMIADVINDMCVSFSIGVYLVYVSVSNGGSIRLGCRNGAVPRFILTSENPFIQFTPGPLAETRWNLICLVRSHFYRNFLGTSRCPSWQRRTTLHSQFTMDYPRQTWRTDTRTRIVRWPYPSNKPARVYFLLPPPTHCFCSTTSLQMVGTLQNTHLLPLSNGNNTKSYTDSTKDTLPIR